jgi:hypothetical protein
MSAATGLDGILEPLSRCLDTESARRVVELQVAAPVQEWIRRRGTSSGGHFVFAGTRIEGISATGRATIQVLAMNDARRLEVRREVLKYGDQT